MKPISYNLPWPMTEDIDEVLTNLSWEKKLELSVALAQRVLDEKQGKEAGDRVQALNLIAPPAPEAIEPPEKNNEPPT
jgi:hypothetical protein